MKKEISRTKWGIHKHWTNGENIMTIIWMQTRTYVYDVKIKSIDGKENEVTAREYFFKEQKIEIDDSKIEDLPDVVGY